MYSFKTSKHFDRTLEKLKKKDRVTYSQILKKIDEIINTKNINHYKNLRYGFKEIKRVHIGHFVLTFKFHKQENLISFEDFDHHDNIYEK